MAPDLRGYGDSSKPPTTDDHEPYSKRAMARDGVAVMARLGFERFAVAGHDRGARVAYRMALDHPERVERSPSSTSIPTAEHVRADRHAVRARLRGTGSSSPQPYDLPERLIAADPEGFYFRGRPSALFAPEALAEYHALPARSARRSTRSARTTARAPRSTSHWTRRTAAPAGSPARCWPCGGSRARSGAGDVLATWRTWAQDVRGAALPCGHHLPEEAPEETTAALRAFLAAMPPRRLR